MLNTHFQEKAEEAKLEGVPRRHLLMMTLYIKRKLGLLTTSGRVSAETLHSMTGKAYESNVNTGCTASNLLIEPKPSICFLAVPRLY